MFNVILAIVAVIVGGSVIGWVLKRVGLGVMEVMEKLRKHEPCCDACEYWDIDPKDLPCRDCMNGRGEHDGFRLRKDR